MTQNEFIFEKKRRIPLFWKIYIGAVAVLLILIHGALFLLNGFLRDYEFAQPKHVAQSIFDSCFLNFSPESFLDLCDSSTTKYETRENLIAYLDTIVKDAEIRYHSVSTGMDDTLQYVVRAGETKFASFSLVKDVGSKDGFTRYKQGSFALYADARTKVDVEIPTGYTLYLNGIEVEQQYIVEEGIQTPSCAHMPEGISGITMEKYRVSGFIQPPAIEVYSPNGEIAPMEEVKSGSYKASVIPDQGLSEQYSEWFIEAATKYAVYMQYDSKAAAIRFSNVAPYFDPNSKLYEEILR